MRKDKKQLNLPKFCIWVVVFSCIGLGCKPTPPDVTGKSRYYATCQHLLDNATGASATILTRYGRLYGGDTATTETACWTYCGVGKVVDGYDKWGQIGFALYRPQDSAISLPAFCFEIMGDTWQQWYSFNQGYGPPMEGSTHSYSCILDTTDGTWGFLYDGYFYNSGFSSNEIWRQPGSVIVWSGEISNFENDMAGTADSPCRFTNLCYATNGDTLIVAHYGSSDYVDSDD
ncbi:MAG: hypothetical protein PHR28_13445, partial [candidate division Zixibacteria bacterium]|nr:hypothetical protein [candidate division Zixibacteria bacterium]